MNKVFRTVLTIFLGIAILAIIGFYVSILRTPDSKTAKTESVKTEAVQEKKSDSKNNQDKDKVAASKQKQDKSKDSDSKKSQNKSKDSDSKKSQDKSKDSDSKQKQDKSKNSASKKKQKNVEITISAAGDCTLGRHTDSSYDASFDEAFDKNGADYFLKNVKPIFKKDDMTVVNFEGTLTDSTDRQIKTFTFKGRDEYLDVLTGSGVDFMSFANNHAHDFGEEGYQDTMDLFEKNDVPYASEEKTGVYKVKGYVLGMVSVHGDVEQKESDYIKESIAELKGQKVDIIIVNIHTGIERAYTQDSKQINLAHTAVNEGADLVLLHHPHVIQGVEFYKGVYIAYSLGNFCFGGNKGPSDKDTLIVQKTFKMKNGKLQRDDQLKIIPCSISSVSSYNNYQPAVLEGSDKERVIRRMNQYSANYHVTFDEDGNASTEEQTETDGVA